MWSIFIPEGGSKPLSAMSPAERDELFARWQPHSVYAQFARWLAERDGAALKRSGGGAP